MGIEENGRHVKTQEEKEQHLGIEGTLSVRGFILLIILLFANILITYEDSLQTTIKDLLKDKAIMISDAFCFVKYINPLIQPEINNQRSCE